LGEDGKHLALAVIGNSAVRDNQFYLQHASSIGTSTHLQHEEELTDAQEDHTIRTLLALGQQYGLPLAMLIFLESKATHEIQTIFSVPATLDPRPAATVLSQLATSRVEKKPGKKLLM